MDGTDPTILVVGSANVGKKALISRITGSSDQALPCTWTIDTRYYTADTNVDAVNCSSADASASHDEGCEALILVVDAAREQTFQEVRTWLSHQSLTPEINLVVLNKTDRLKQPDGTIRREQWHTAAQDWCSEKLLECIEVSAVDSEVDQSLSTGGDRQGVARVVEALKAHVWPGLQLKSQLSNGALHDNAALPTTQQAPAQQARTTGVPGTADRGVQANSGNSAQSASSGPGQAGAPAAGVSFSEAAHANHNGPTANGTARNGASQSDRSQPPGLLELGEASDDVLGIDDSEEDDELQTFDHMLARLSAAREQLQGLPDDQRRARAAALAMQMLDSFGLDEDESDNE